MTGRNRETRCYPTGIVHAVYEKRVMQNIFCDLKRGDRNISVTPCLNEEMLEEFTAQHGKEKK
jgi:hypothetical protein